MAVAEQSISLKTRRKTEVRIVLGWHRRDRAFLSVKSTAGKIITAPLRRVVGKNNELKGKCRRKSRAAQPIRKHKNFKET